MTSKADTDSMLKRVVVMGAGFLLSAAVVGSIVGVVWWAMGPFNAATVTIGAEPMVVDGQVPGNRGGEPVWERCTISDGDLKFSPSRETVRWVGPQPEGTSPPGCEYRTELRLTPELESLLEAGQ